MLNFGSDFGCLFGLGEIPLLGVQWNALSAVDQMLGLPKQILAEKKFFSLLIPIGLIEWKW